MNEKEKKPAGDESQQLRIVAEIDDGPDAVTNDAAADGQTLDETQQADNEEKVLEEKARKEDYWAGRNSAMRRSARAAA